LPTKSCVLVSLIGIDLPSGVWPAEVAIWMTASISSFEGWDWGTWDEARSWAGEREL